MRPELIKYLLATLDKERLMWAAKDDGTDTGKLSLRPTHAYTLYMDEMSKPQFEKRPLKVGERISPTDLKLILRHTNPDAARYKALFFGIGIGAFVTLTSIMTSMLIAQIVMDEEKQQDIFNEAQRAIAICTATQEISQGNYSAAERALDEAAPFFKNSNKEPSPLIQNESSVQQSSDTLPDTTETLWQPTTSQGNISTNESLTTQAEPTNEDDLWHPTDTVNAEQAVSSVEKKAGESDTKWQPQ